MEQKFVKVEKEQFLVILCALQVNVKEYDLKKKKKNQSYILHGFFSPFHLQGPNNLVSIGNQFILLKIIVIPKSELLEFIFTSSNKLLAFKPISYDPLNLE